MSEAGLKEGEEKGLDITKGRIGIDRGNVGGRVKWGGRRRMRQGKE